MSFYESTVLEIKQPFATFYAFKIPAHLLLEIAFTDPIRYNEKGELVGTQRTLDEQKRVGQIKEFLQGDEAALPNAIILAANYDSDGLSVQDEEKRWHVVDGKIIIPTGAKLAAIIDGQHRLFGFEEANSETKKMELLCSVYFDLPNALQAHMFATINTTQVKVDRSLAYIQFGFNVEKEPITSWSPDKLAIVLYKKFNQENDSPFYKHIKIAPQMNEEMKTQFKESGKTWLVSTATIVDGIIRLISVNPKRDKYMLQQQDESERRRSILPDDPAPLRKLYTLDQDSVIFKITSNFFLAARDVLFANSSASSSITKTVGIQALFDVLRSILLDDKRRSEKFDGIDLRKERFEIFLSSSRHTDFSDDYYQFSGVGRKRIADAILLKGGLIEVPDSNDTRPSKIKLREYLLELRRHVSESDASPN